MLISPHLSSPLLKTVNLFSINEYFGYSMTTRIFLVFISLLLAHLFRPQQVFAYIDPGSGSYVLQILFATAIGLFFSLKTILKKIGNLVNKFKKK